VEVPNPKSKNPNPRQSLKISKLQRTASATLEIETLGSPWDLGFGISIVGFLAVFAARNDHHYDAGDESPDALIASGSSSVAAPAICAGSAIAFLLSSTGWSSEVGSAGLTSVTATEFSAADATGGFVRGKSSELSLNSMT